MIKVVAGIDVSNGGVFCVTIDTELLKRFFNNLCGMLKNRKGVPSGLKLERTSPTTLLITFPIDKKYIKEFSSDGGKIAVSLEVKKYYDKVLNVIEEFSSKAIANLLKRVEFIPLYEFDGIGKAKDYSIEEMREDVKAAVDNGRDICIISSYSQFLDMTSRNYVFDQYYIDHVDNAEEYSDFCIDAWNGKLDKLRKKYKGKLSTVNWI